MLVRQVAYDIYARSMQKSIAGEPVPRCIALVISDADLVDDRAIAKLTELAGWSAELHVGEIFIYVSITETSIVVTLTESIRDTFAHAGFPAKIVSPDMVAEIKGDRPCKVNISIGFGGKHELTNALREIMDMVKAGKIKPSDIDEAMVESHLVFRSEPDLFIRTGEERLSDFLIWQSVYSELYFTDVNWENFRKIDLLRAIRDYQYRQRRFGK
ncbi:MAG: Tritrans,polycis-undecaprenyl-diphosphate synthase (GGDP specific) [Methanocella sp. PtaU1.Bin125]|nr:MAG: Tritrans,polycis-undecaprenyl-diphosphate synthase (GGDP specific) [Methanocella sp. PtaU1.Bin125]